MNRIRFDLLQIVTGGEGFHWVDFDRLPLRHGDVLHLGSGQAHAFDRDSTHEALLVVFLPEAIPGDLLRLAGWGRSGVVHLPGEETEVLVSIAELMLEVQKRKLEAGNETQRFLLAAVLGLVREAARRDEPTSRPARTSVAFDELVDRHFADPLGLEWYAAQLGISTRTLSRICLKSRGVTPKQHLDRRRGLEAKRLLLDAERTVRQVGVVLGFEETTNFVKFFRRVVGQTPTEFRRAVGIGARAGSRAP
ncbi:MAG: AraC family transcriptional regulator [Acidobacteriota bacterium]